MFKNKYNAYFYVDSETNKVPVQEYLQTKNDKDRGRFRALVEHFEENGKLPFPYASYVKDELWEIRIQVKKDKHRIIYAIVSDKKIILLSIFIKNTPKIPPDQIAVAKKRINDYYKNKNS